MKNIVKIIIVLFLSSSLVAGSTCPVSSQEKRVRAKIGIQIKSGDRIMRAKSRDTIKAGDLFRIYVHPEETSHVYVVHTDHKTATLLNMVQQKIQSSTLVMPSIQELYQVDGKSPIETLTIICSPNELTEAIDVLASGEALYSRWAEFENGLLERSKIDLSQKPERPFAIAGNVRGTGGTGNLDPFVSELQIFSGKSILVKRYEFRVKR